jgi:hypothetical protein
LRTDYVGHHVARVDRRILGAGARIERADQVLRLAQFVVVAAQRLADACEVARRELVEVILDDGQRQLARRAVVEAQQLQRQAFLRIARTDARRVEVLQVTQGDAEFFQQDFAQIDVVSGPDQQVDQFIQRLRQVAVVVERLDQEADQRAFAVRHLGQADLGAEVLAQRRGRGLGLAAVDVVVVGVALYGAGRSSCPSLRRRHRVIRPARPSLRWQSVVAGVATHRP